MASRERNNEDVQAAGAGTTSEYTDMEAALKLDKSRAKSNFTRVKNKLLFLVEGEGIGTSREVQEACDKLDISLERTMDVFAELSGLYMKNKDNNKARKVALESDKLEEDYKAAYDAASRYLRSLKREQSSETSEILTIDMLNGMNIGETAGTNQRQESIGMQETSRKVGFGASSYEKNDTETRKHEELSTYHKTESQEIGLNHESEQHGNAGITSLGASNRNSLNQHAESSEYCDVKPNRNIHVTTMNAHASPFEPTQSFTESSLGNDMWRQFKRVQIPTFSGNRKHYQNWKAAFLSCVDSAPATAEYKLLQLRQYLSGDALKVIDSLGHSATAYEAAKDRLERKYGGKRRQIAIYLDELEQFRQIRPGNARDIEEFADLLDIAMINLKEAGQDYELGNGSLYLKLQRKLPETMIARYNRWMFENYKEASVMTLRTWVLQESEFVTIASETARGFTGRTTNDAAARAVPRYENPRTFFGETNDRRDTPKFKCQDCGKQHGIWSCRVFAQRSVRDRWNLARRLQLCFRCLGENHQGNSCPRSRPCGLNGCEDMHHRLLHKQGSGEQKPTDDTEINLPEPGKSSTARAENENVSNG